jgi:hypothetical protein
VWQQKLNLSGGTTFLVAFASCSRLLSAIDPRPNFLNRDGRSHCAQTLSLTALTADLALPTDPWGPCEVVDCVLGRPVRPAQGISKGVALRRPHRHEYPMQAASY